MGSYPQSRRDGNNGGLKLDRGGRKGNESLATSLNPKR